MLKLGKMLRSAGGLEKGSLVEILKGGRRMKVRALNSFEEVEVGRSIIRVLKAPEQNISLRMVREAEFDQKCGCTSVVEFKKRVYEHFNVYGDIGAYLEDNERKGSDLTPHHRRKQLKEKGFVRSKGIKAPVRDPRRKIRKYERQGYEPV